MTPRVPPPGRIRMPARASATPPLVLIEPAAPPVPRGGPPPGRGRLPARPAPPARVEPSPLVLPPRRPNPAREAVVAREARERAERLQGIADRRERDGLAPLGLTGTPNRAAVQHNHDPHDDPTVRLLLDTFAGAAIVAVRSVHDIATRTF